MYLNPEDYPSSPSAHIELANGAKSADCNVQLNKVVEASKAYFNGELSQAELENEMDRLNEFNSKESPYLVAACAVRTIVTYLQEFHYSELLENIANNSEPSDFFYGLSKRAIHLLRTLDDLINGNPDAYKSFMEARVHFDESINEICLSLYLAMSDAYERLSQQ